MTDESRQTCKYRTLSALFGDGRQINDLYMDWLTSGGATALQNNDKQMQFLDLQNIPRFQQVGTRNMMLHLNNRWMLWLEAQGFTDPNINDRWQKYWCSVAGDPTNPGNLPDGFQLINLPLLKDLYSSTPAGADATFARNSVATVTDFEGNVRDVKVDEARFQGARRVEELAISNNDLRQSGEGNPVSIWFDTIAGTGTVDSVTYDGEKSRVALNLNGGTSSGDQSMRRQCEHVEQPLEPHDRVDGGWRAGGHSALDHRAGYPIRFHRRIREEASIQ